MAGAFIFVEVVPARSRDVLEELRRRIPGAEVHEVMGPYDIVVKLQRNTSREIGVILRDQVRTLEGVIHTVTCPWLQ